MKLTNLLCFALAACLAACAVPAVADPLMTSIGIAHANASPAVMLAAGAAAVLADAVRKPQLGDLVTFVAGDHDPVFVAGSLADGEVVHVWSDQCVNIVITDISGEKHSRTSVRLVPQGSVDKVGHCASLKSEQVETATG